jgi:hypothetical protein
MLNTTPEYKSEILVFSYIVQFLLAATTGHSLARRRSLERRHDKYIPTHINIGTMKKQL